MNPMGSVMLDGFGRYTMYFKDALEKLKITSHVFRVGTFKSAVEPYTRNDMSEEAKEANKQWLSVLWDHYKNDVAELRQLNDENFDETLAEFLDSFKEAGGDFARYAITNNLVDSLMTHQEFDEYLKSRLDTSKPKIIAFNDYLNFVGQKLPTLSSKKVAIIVANGTIYDGNKKPGEIGGHSTAELLKMAREDDSVKSVVLRVNSPGGSVFASEVIRNEVEAIRAAGKPVVASMSSMAASGGYWISASADEIWASPTTITGSIGIFGMFMTYENALGHIGVNTDGVGTTEIAGFSPTRALPEQLGQIIQLSIEQGYNEFLRLVATNRNMTIEEVDRIAQGRVWSGQTAKEHGLVDELGYLDDAIAAAARLANLEDYTVETIQKPAKGFDKIIQELLGVAQTTFGYEPEPQPTSKLKSVIGMVFDQTSQWLEFNDPNHVYIYCLECTAVK